MNTGRTYVRHKRCGNKPNYRRQQLYAGNDQKGSGILRAKCLWQQNSGKSEQIWYSRRICNSDAYYGNDDRWDVQRGDGEEGIEKAAFMAKSTDFSRYVAMARSVIGQTAKNPNAQLAFIQGAGHSTAHMLRAKTIISIKRMSLADSAEQRHVCS